MCCCKKRCVSWTVAIFSLLFIITSGISIYLTTRLNNYDTWYLQADNSIDNERSDKIKQGVFYGTITLLSLTIAIGMFGIGLVKYRNFWTIGVFASLTLIMTVLVLGTGIGFAVFKTGTSKYINQYCEKGQYDTLTSKLGQYHLNYLSGMDKKMIKLVNTNMCSAQCPCTPVTQSKWGSLLKSQSSNSGRQYVFTGKYTNFISCYQDLVSQNKIPTADLLSPNQLGFIQRLEQKSECSALCKPATFWFFRDVREGPPLNSCQSAIEKMYQNQMGVLSVALIITGVLIFLTFNAQYGFWRKSKPRRRSGIDDPPIVIEPDSTDEIQVTEKQTKRNSRQQKYML